MDELGSQLWPIHLKPRQDELLSSWIIRLAHGHGYKTEKMCCMLFGRQHAIWCRDIDKLAPDWVLSKLCLITGTAMSRAVQTTLADYAGFVTEQISPNGDCPWIVPAHIYHRQRTKPGLMYCPICLKHDEVPYFRRIWRLAFITMCTTHGVHLLDNCPDCGAAVMPHRVDIGPDAVLPRDRSLIRCWKCGFDLRTAPTTTGSEELQLFTRQLEDIVSQGFVAFVGNPNLYSVHFFAGLRVVVRFAAKVCGLKKVAIENMALANRQTVITELSKLMASWPANFVGALIRRKARYSDIVDPHDSLPYWLETCTQTFKKHQRADWNSEEIAAVAQVIVNHHGHLNGATARKEYGVYLPCDKLPSAFRSSVSEDCHETLMATLDQSVAATFDPKKRFAFLQDKVMFCLFRFTAMSTVDIADLRMSWMESLAIDTEELDVMHAASSSKEAFRHLQHHIRSERSKFKGSADCLQVFFSPYTGRAYTDSGLQMRFQKAVRQAFLTAAVPSMNAYKTIAQVTV